MVFLTIAFSVCLVVFALMAIEFYCLDDNCSAFNYGVLSVIFGIGLVLTVVGIKQ